MILVTEQCRHEFTAEEIAALARKQNGYLDSIEAAEADLDEVKAAHKQRITLLENHVNEIRKKISSGQEMREVQCIVLKFRPDAEHKIIVRLDNGAVLKKEKLSVDERQLKLTTEAPEGWAFTADFFFECPNGGTQQELCGTNIPITAEEAAALKSVLRMTPKRRALGSAGGK